MAVEQDYFEILRIRRNATREEIKAAYRRSVRLYHPDVCRNKEFGDERFKLVQQAYEALSRDPDKYRRALQQNTPRRPPPQARPAGHAASRSQTPAWERYTTIPREKRKTLQDMPTDKALQRFGNTDSREERTHLAELLAMRRDSAGTVAVLRGVYEGDPAVQAGAAVGFGRGKSARGVYALVDLLGNRSRNVSETARWALGELPRALVCAVLERRLKEVALLQRIRISRLLKKLQES